MSANRAGVAAIVALAATLLGACSTSAPTSSSPLSLGADPAAACAALTAPVPPSAIGLPSGAATIESATLMPETALAVAERGPNPAARIAPPAPPFCRVLGRVAPLDPTAPPIRFQVPALVEWGERGRAPSGLEIVEQPVQAPLVVTRAHPLCGWPQWPRYRGGDAAQASSFECTR